MLHYIFVFFLLIFNMNVVFERFKVNMIIATKQDISKILIFIRLLLNTKKIVEHYT